MSNETEVQTKPYKRKIILINKSFQLKMSFILTSWILALAFIYPSIVFFIFERLAESITHPRLEEVSLLIQEQNEIIFSRTILLYICFGVLTFLLSLFVSHKIAGPLYKLNNAMNAVTEGSQDQKIFFRNSDYFKELAESFNQMLDKVLSGNTNIKNNSFNAHINNLENIHDSLSEDQKKVIDALLVDLKKNA